MRKYLGKKVEVVMDRPLGSKHPKYGYLYPINYGYIPSTVSGDGEEIDAYIIGEFEPLESYEGYVIAIIHRENDNEDKLIVCKELSKYNLDQIRALVEFQERFFKSEIIMYENKDRDIVIRKLNKDENIPYNILFLADPSIDMINEYIHKGECFVACDMNKVVGVYVLIRTNPETLELVNIAVDEEYQGKGIGKELIFHAINRAKVLDVGTGNSSIMQLALYQKCGFRISGIDKDFFRKHYKEKIMENGIECTDMIRLSREL